MCDCVTQAHVVQQSLREILEEGGLAPAREVNRADGAAVWQRDVQAQAGEDQLLTSGTRPSRRFDCSDGFRGPRETTTITSVIFPSTDTIGNS